MLSSTYQLNAYKALVAAGGLTTPASATSATSAAVSAQNLSDTLAAMLLATVSYPSTVSASVSSITDWSSALVTLATDATSYAALMTKYADPSVLIQLTTGWDVYCRSNDLNASELTISAAIGDDSEPAALVAALAAVSTTAIAAAMSDINTTLSTTATTTTTTTTPALSDAQIAALTAAVTTLTPLMAAVATAHSTLTARYTAAQSSATEAEDAFSNAISVALISSSVSSTAVGSAVSAITPAAVLAILEQGSS